MVSSRTNRERAAECLQEVQECLDHICRHYDIGFPINPVIVGHLLRLSEMYAQYMTEPDEIWGDISK